MEHNFVLLINGRGFLCADDIVDWKLTRDKILIYETRNDAELARLDYFRRNPKSGERVSVLEWL